MLLLLLLLVLTRSPRRQGWFLKFDPHNHNTTMKRCAAENKTKCSVFYHDQEQTPAVPVPGQHGPDGACTDNVCDVGTQPCGEVSVPLLVLPVVIVLVLLVTDALHPTLQYLFDHRNGSMLRDWIVNEHIGGPAGLGDPAIDGFFIDDFWCSDLICKENPHICTHCTDPVQGPTEIDSHSQKDMGLTDEAIKDITLAWNITMGAVQAKILKEKGYTWSLIPGQENANASPIMMKNSTCAAMLRAICTDGKAGRWQKYSTLFGLTTGPNQTLPQLEQDIAFFSIARGPFAWLGWGTWGIGWPFNPEPAHGTLPARPGGVPLPPILAKDFGTPKGLCEEASPGIFERAWSSGTFRLDCNKFVATLPAVLPKVKTDDASDFNGVDRALEAIDERDRAAPFPPNMGYEPVLGNWSVPVLSPDNATWEHTAVQEPQVIWMPELKLLRMWYRGGGWNVPSGLGVADSTDRGKTWTRFKGNPVWGARGIAGEAGGQPWVYREAADKYWLYTTFSNAKGRAAVQIAKSADGLKWSNVSIGAVPLPSKTDARPNRSVTGTMFGNRAVWKDSEGKWHMLAECGTSEGVWEIFLYAGASATEWKVVNGPLYSLQRHAHSMFGGVHIATVDGKYAPKDPSGRYNCWFHAGADGNLPTDIYHASSTDLITWTVLPSTPVISHRGTGAGFAYDQVADPSPLVADGYAYIAFDGDDNRAGAVTHAAIGMGVVKLKTDDGTTKPSLIVILADDFGFNDAGFRNHEQIHTPALDKLMAEGILLDNYYVQPSCSPTRSCVMSGRWPLHTGINNYIPNEPYGLPLDEVTMAQLLKKNGYATHAVGKWHLGFHRWEFTPTFRGFDSFFGFYFGSQDYFTHIDVFKPALDLHREKGANCGFNCSLSAFSDGGKYSTNLYAEEAVKIIGDHDAAKQPLFLYQAFQAVHAPRQAPTYYSDKYKTSIKDPARRVFAGMVHALSEGIGNITAAMEAKGMMANAVIIFTTDNGGPIHECAGIGASNLPLRGGKCSVLEGGTKGTAFLHSALLKKRGYAYAGLMHAVDWLPTLIGGAAGIDLAGKTKPLDGIDQWAALSSQSTEFPRKVQYYGVTDSSIGIHGPALRNQQGDKIILNGFGGTGGWDPLPASSSALGVGAGSGGICDDYTIHTNRFFPGSVLQTHTVGNGSDAQSKCCGFCTASSPSGPTACTGFTVNMKQGICYTQHTHCVYTKSCHIPKEGTNVVAIRNHPPPENLNCSLAQNAGKLPHAFSFNNYCTFLFDVSPTSGDDSEHKPRDLTAAANKATLQSLNATLQSLWATRVPQAAATQPNQCPQPQAGVCTCAHPIGPCLDKKTNRTYVCPYCETDAPVVPGGWEALGVTIDVNAES